MKGLSSDLAFSDPTALLAAAEDRMRHIPDEELFNNPTNQTVLEQWCAGWFGVGYGRHVSHCRIAMSSTVSDADFYLHARGNSFPFQLTEVQEPGRRRGAEYRGPRQSAPYRPGAARANGPSWIESGVQKKADKCYAGVNQLNILVYADFTADALQWTDVAARLERFDRYFASVWVMAYNVMGSAFSTPELGTIGACKGWGMLRDSSDWR